MKSRMPNRFGVSLFILLTFLISGCAGAKLKDARQAFYQGDVRKAVDIIHDVDDSGLSRLEYLMEKGMLLFHAGEYEQSIRELRQAADLIREQDIISLGQQAGSVVVNEWITEYKGEYSERLWVHTYLMMNYLLLMQYEGALVEAKQAQMVLDEYPDALAHDYATRALIAMCYEMLGEYNDAYIVYKKLLEKIPDKSLIAPDIRRLARMLGFQDELESLGISETGSEPSFSTNKNPAELVLFVSMGTGPQKTAGNLLIPPGIRISFPRYKKKSGYGGSPAVAGSRSQIVSTKIETDLLAVARDSLDERAAQVIIKEAARVAAKEMIVRGFEKDNHNSLAGLLLRMAFIAMEEADTRGWETLPAKLSLVRVFLEPGIQKIRVNITGGSYSTIDLPDMSFSPGQIAFFALRASGGTVSVNGMRKEEERREEALPEQPEQVNHDNEMD